MRKLIVAMTAALALAGCASVPEKAKAVHVLDLANVRIELRDEPCALESLMEGADEAVKKSIKGGTVEYKPDHGGKVVRACWMDIGDGFVAVADEDGASGVLQTPPPASKPKGNSI